jgi:hypothetical protein
VAKFRADDPLLLDPATERQASVHICHIELGNEALPPRPLRKEHEAVYLVQCDSTSTTLARGRPFWVTEDRLEKRPMTREPPTRGGGPGWSRLWGKGRTFEQCRQIALRELQHQLEHEKRMSAPEAEWPPPRLRAAVRKQPVNIIYRMEEGLVRPASARHTPAANARLTTTPPRPASARVHGGGAAAAAGLTAAALAARPPSLQLHLDSPRQQWSHQHPPLSPGGTSSVGQQQQQRPPPRARPQSAATGLTPSRPQTQRMSAAGQLRPSSAVRPGTPGRVPVRPYSAAAGAVTPALSPRVSAGAPSGPGAGGAAACDPAQRPPTSPRGFTPRSARPASARAAAVPSGSAAGKAFIPTLPMPKRLHPGTRAF